MTSEQRLRLIGQMQSARKQAVGNPNGRNMDGTFQLGQNELIGNKPKSTAETIAHEVGVSESTVKRAEKFSKERDSRRNWRLPLKLRLCWFFDLRFDILHIQCRNVCNNDCHTSRYCDTEI